MREKEEPRVTPRYSVWATEWMVVSPTDIFRIKEEHILRVEDDFTSFERNFSYIQNSQSRKIMIQMCFSFITSGIQ